MIRIGSKTRVHSREEIAGYVQEAQEIIDAATIDPGVGPAIFPQVLALVSQHQIEVEQTQMTPAHEGYRILGQGKR